MIANIANQLNAFSLEPKIVESDPPMKTSNKSKFTSVKAATQIPEEISLAAAASDSDNTGPMNFTSE